MILALRLAKGGWWNGNPGDVLRAPADEVMLAVHYEDFRGEYETSAMNLAKQDAQ